MDMSNYSTFTPHPGLTDEDRGPVEYHAIVVDDATELDLQYGLTLRAYSGYGGVAPITDVVRLDEAHFRAARSANNDHPALSATTYVVRNLGQSEEDIVAVYRANAGYGRGFDYGVSDDPAAAYVV